jgi:hypothetical protein
MQDQELTEKIIGCAMKVHSVLGPGFLESVYQKALAHELGKAGLKVECEKPITVHYDGIAVGEISADMLVEDRVLRRWWHGGTNARKPTAPGKSPLPTSSPPAAISTARIRAAKKTSRTCRLANSPPAS